MSQSKIGAHSITVLVQVPPALVETSQGALAPSMDLPSVVSEFEVVATRIKALMQQHEEYPWEDMQIYHVTDQEETDVVYLALRVTFATRHPARGGDYWISLSVLRRKFENACSYALEEMRLARGKGGRR